MDKLNGAHLPQVKRYEQSDGEPPMGVIRKFARSLNVTAVELIFDDYERGPEGDFRYEFNAMRQFDDESKETSRQFLHVFIQQYQSKMLSQRSKKSA
ncbi:MAG: hypothetical protein AAGB02_00230 [Pseudomonadota bacterium]